MLRGVGIDGDRSHRLGPELKLKLKLKFKFKLKLKLKLKLQLLQWCDGRS
jgi:hypothetical protein